MSEFTYACPVCHQHLKCPVSQAGTVMKCPTCYQRIVAPQAPSSADSNLVFTGHRYVEKKTAELPTAPSRPASAAEPTEPGKKMPVGLIVGIILVVLVAAGAAWMLKSGKLPLAKAPLKSGMAGVGSWATAVEYDNLVITKGKKVLYKSNFASGMAGWQPGDGTWSTTGGFLRQTATAYDCRALIGEADWGDYTISVRARKLSGGEGFLIIFNAVDKDNFTWWNIGGWSNSKHAIQHTVANQRTALGDLVPGKIKTGEWYDLRVELSGLRIRCYLNNELIHDLNYPAAN